MGVTLSGFGAGVDVRAGLEDRQRPFGVAVHQGVERRYAHVVFAFGALLVLQLLGDTPGSFRVAAAGEFAIESSRQGERVIVGVGVGIAVDLVLQQLSCLAQVVCPA